MVANDILNVRFLLGPFVVDCKKPAIPQLHRTRITDVPPALHMRRSYTSFADDELIGDIPV